MKKFKYLSKNETETKKLAESFSSYLKKGDILVLSGELGAGKTTFVKGLISGCGIKKEVLSPSFTLVKEYTGKIKIFHIDLYRLNLKEALNLNLEEYFSQGITLIEWGEKIENILETYIKLSFFFKSLTEREIIFYFDKEEILRFKDFIKDEFFSH